MRLHPFHLLEPLHSERTLVHQASTHTLDLAIDTAVRIPASTEHAVELITEERLPSTETQTPVNNPRMSQPMSQPTMIYYMLVNIPMFQGNGDNVELWLDMVYEA
ncbi:hypothetical protein PVAG01_05361 [Phlyctema vagabunda]|uniref:Uncharacterized protein n=1 Tax=Phlyctema vagabunda TaxID=108571 RepID=A0ABR4PK06_9HELO